MRIRYILIFLILLVISVAARPQQIKSFSDSPATFFQEMTTFFQDLDNPDDKKIAKEFMQQFTLEWNGNKFSDDQKTEMISTCNQMLKRKMKPIPHFKNYISTIISFNNTSQPETSFKAWEASLDKLINRPTSSQFIDYLDISNKLFSENILYKSPTTTWKSSNSDYTFEYDTIPRIIFPSLDLACYANNDSTVIYGTKGIYYPTLGKFIGKGGKVLWVRAGFSADSVHAELKRYNITVKYSKFTADSVEFFNINYFSKPLLGKLEEKVLADQNEDKASYPRFESYDKRLRIDNIFPDIDYDGGFSMHGGKLMGSGDANQDAILIFHRDDKKFVKTSAKTYLIRKNKISSDAASVTIYWEKDSIYHPGLHMKYLDDSKELSLLRGNDGISKTPFFDTYHKLDIYIEALYWKMDQPIIDMKMIKGVGAESEALFESYNYFSSARYYKLMGIDETHPLSDLRKFAKLKKTNVVSVPEYAKYLKIELTQIEALLLTLSNMGFIAYDMDNNKVYLKEKLDNFLLSRAGKIDYDVIQFNSLTNGQNNATLNLLNFDLKLNGVKSVYLSDSQAVYIFPKDEKLVVKKNRDFEFDGLIHAGLFDFFGKQYSFSYDKFKIDMPVVDSMAFYVKSFKPDENGKTRIVKVKSVIEGIKGNLQIDGPNNKSGLKPRGIFPLFNSLKDSYVYYDKKSINRGVYLRDKFYFHVDPFDIDSLDNISTEGIGFKGDFVSSDIFPDINEILKVQPDYSLGFVKLAPEPGYSIYKGKGIFDSIVNLSNRGLKGNGTLNYLTSTSRSNDFNFYPDSMDADVQSYIIREQKVGIEYPTVIGEDVYEHWMPYNDFMIVSTIEKPIAMYDLDAKIKGNLVLTPSSLTGRGTMTFKDAEMDAKLFKFKNRKFDSDTADFRLKSYDLSELAFSTHNYRSHIDFDARKGEFKSNGGVSKVEFPLNLYICFMDEFDWYMDKEEIDLSNTKNKNIDKLNNLNLKELADIDISGSEFVSVHPSQDSLRFFSPRAKFNLKENIIHAKDVKIIKVADAAIYPDKGDVTILKKAVMEPLINAKILANTTTKYHTIYNALVNITSRKNYSANGTYDYKDRKGTKSPIYLSKIGVDTTLQTYGKGVISETPKFSLSPDFDFMGNVKLLASDEYLNFDGTFKIKHDCDANSKPWVKFHSDINPNDIYIPISDTIQDISNNKLEAGVLITTFKTVDSVYSVFLSKKIKPIDQNVITARGFLYYDTISQEYRISNKEKLKQLNQPGNYVSLTKESCISYGDGKVDLAPNLGRVTMNTYGNVKQYIIPDSTILDLVMGIDFFFSDNALKLINEDFEKHNTLTAVDLTRITFTKALTEILGIKEADKLISDVSMNGAFKRIPSELQHTLLLGDVQMKWDPINKFFVSDGPIGVVAIDKNQINKYIKGYITIKKHKSGDEMNIYLEFDPNDWYFFQYKGTVMQALSSNKEFNTVIRETKPDKRTLSAEKGLPQYTYTLLPSEAPKKSFLKKVEPAEDKEEPNNDDKNNDKQ